MTRRNALSCLFRLCSVYMLSRVTQFMQTTPVCKKFLFIFFSSTGKNKGKSFLLFSVLFRPLLRCSAVRCLETSITNVFCRKRERIAGWVGWIWGWCQVVGSTQNLKLHWLVSGRSLSLKKKSKEVVTMSDEKFEGLRKSQSCELSWLASESINQAGSVSWLWLSKTPQNIVPTTSLPHKPHHQASVLFFYPSRILLLSSLVFRLMKKKTRSEPHERRMSEVDEQKFFLLCRSEASSSFFFLKMNFL